MAPTRPRPALPRPLAVLGLVVLLSGLAAGANLTSAEAPVHDHASHSHDDVEAYAAGVEPADLAPDAVNGVAAGDLRCSATVGLKLPDLQMALVPRDTVTDGRIRIVNAGTPAEGEPAFPPGTKLMRFTSVIMNTGAGPFHVKGTVGSDPEEMATRQKIYTTSTVSSKPTQCQLYPTDAIAKFRGDGHNHWHIEKVQQFQLLSTTGSGLGFGYKTGFCFFDGIKKRRYLPGHPQYQRFPYSGCGWSSGNTSISMGLSVGWGDVYPASIAHQWIDVTGLANGSYRLCQTADPFDHYRESNDANNQVYSDIQVAGMGTGSPTVTTTARVSGPCSA